jgi:hypothetical protein
MKNKAVKYPGIQEYIGKSGKYIISYDDDDLPGEPNPTIDIFLKSPVIYYGESDEPANYLTRTEEPDVSIQICGPEDWFCCEMTASIGTDGVKEFISALFRNPSSVDQAEDCLNVIRSLLDQEDAPWGIREE